MRPFLQYNVDCAGDPLSPTVAYTIENKLNTDSNCWAVSTVESILAQSFALKRCWCLCRQSLLFHKLR